jgi:hypothetical protein
LYGTCNAFRTKDLLHRMNGFVYAPPYKNK